MLPHSGKSGTSLTAFVLFPADLLILYAAFVGALKARLSAWILLPHTTDLGAGLPITMAVFAVALIGSGLYRMQPQSMHLREFLRVSVSMLVAWTISVTLTYLTVPDRMPPRSVTTVHALLSLVGVLGLRALIRQAYEWVRPEAALPSPTPAIRIQDVLPRAPLEIDTAALRDYFSSRTMLVTGAGGSIGSELSRQIAALQPFRLVLVDISEYNLFQLENMLRQAGRTELVFRIGDVRDREVMQTIFSSFRPDVVFHAAAYKHVPLMERHPVEAFRNNTLTTVELLQLCAAYQSEQFVLISTDKAVEPAGVLGATKRLAEWYTRAAGSDVQRKVVRFGNVFGSQGSLTPILQEQIACGGPVLLTHPDMERYFMSDEEACRLILQTVLLDEAPVYILDMGEPVRIRELAESLIARTGDSGGHSIEIRYTGVRPGEKLREKLWEESESPVPTGHKRIIGIRSQAPYSRAELDAHLAALKELCRNYEAETLRKALLQPAIGAETEART